MIFLNSWRRKESVCVIDVSQGSLESVWERKILFLLALITVCDDLCDVSASRRGGPGPHTCAEQRSRPVQWTRAGRGPVGQGIQRSWGAVSLAWARPGLAGWLGIDKRPQALLCVQDTWTGSPRPSFEEIRRARTPTEILRCLHKANWVRRAD
jgi:hypothetical protein